MFDQCYIFNLLFFLHELKCHDPRYTLGVTSRIELLEVLHNELNIHKQDNRNSRDYKRLVYIIKELLKAKWKIA